VSVIKLAEVSCNMLWPTTLALYFQCSVFMVVVTNGFQWLVDVAAWC